MSSTLSSHLIPQRPSSDREDQPTFPTCSDCPEPADSGPFHECVAEVSETGRTGFLDSFFHEKNIRWMLVMGAAIVFGSSLMLVTHHWDSWPVTVKYLTVLGYTAAVFACAEFGRLRLNLRATAVVLHVLTVLLMPLCFMALSWLSSGTAAQSGLLLTELMALMLPATVMTWYLGTRVFDHLLRGRQTSFLLCYLALSVFGVLPNVRVLTAEWSVSSGVAAAAAMVMTMVFWSVMTVGAIKVTRHIFWLTEEHRWPRVFGFFPVALLGAQFLMLSATKTLGAVPVQWLGLMLVMTAGTILLTTRTVASVFRQRTGDLIRPLPLHISLPMFIGLAVATGGVVMSFHGFHYVGETTFAVVPTCALAAGLMLLAARETGHRSFVWAALILVTIAYQCAPTMFSDIVNRLRQSAAAAIQERRLPVAFYGLTYLPLVTCLTVLFRRIPSHRALQFRSPLKHFSTLIVCVCYAAAMSNLKAAFLVSVVNAAVFTGLALMFRDRRYIAGTLLATLVAVTVLVPFLNTMTVLDLPAQTYVLTCLAAFALVCVSSGMPDRLLQRIPLPAGTGCPWFAGKDGQDRAIVQKFGFGVAAAVAGIWSLSMLGSAGQVWTASQAIQFLLLLAVFVQHTVRRQTYAGGMSVWVLCLIAGLCFSAGLSLESRQLVDLFSVLMAVISLGGLVVLKRLHRDTAGFPALSLMRCGLRKSAPQVDVRGVWADMFSPTVRVRLTEAFVVPLCDLSLAVLLCLAASYHAGRIGLANVTLGAFPLTAATQVTVIWLFVAGYLFKTHVCWMAGSAVLPLLVSGSLNSLQPGLVTPELMPLVWSVVGSALLWGGVAGSRNELMGPRMMGRLWLTVVMTAGLFVFSLPVQTASLLSLASLLLMDRRQRSVSETTWLAIMASLQTLLFVGSLSGLTGFVPFVFRHELLADAAPLLLLTAAISMLIFDRFSDKLDPVATRSWAGVLRVLMTMLVLVSFAARSVSILSAVCMICGLLTYATVEWKKALERQREAHVWAGLASVAAGWLWLSAHGIVHPGSAIGQIVLLCLSLVCLAVSWQLRGRVRVTVFQRPLRIIGLTAPVIASLVATGRVTMDQQQMTTGLNSLTVFFSAGLYFHQWMLTRQRAFAVVAGLIGNLGFLLLWHSLQISDPQFYMVPVGLSILGLVELLKRELPISAHDPLRYVGSLIVLVSPLFHILGGSWVHLLSLLVLCVLVILLAIGLRLRAVVFTGTAFLMADLVAIVVRGAWDRPVLLWVGGLMVGLGVIALAAVCENHREKLLQRIRMLSAHLAAWD